MSPSFARLSSSEMEDLDVTSSSRSTAPPGKCKVISNQDLLGEQCRKQGGDFLGCCCQAFLLQILQGNGFAKPHSANFLFFTCIAYSRALHYLLCCSVYGNQHILLTPGCSLWGISAKKLWGLIPVNRP